MSCPYCGDEGFVGKPSPEDSICSKCGARFEGCDKPVNLLKCTNRNCGRHWIYKGRKTFPNYTSCPACKGSVRCP